MFSIFYYIGIILPVNCVGETTTEIMAEAGNNVPDGDGSADDTNPEEAGNHDPDGDVTADTNPEEDPELTQLQAEEDELAQRVSAEVSEELSSHIAKLEQELKLAFDERMSALHQQCSTQAAEDISTRQVCGDASSYTY